MKTFTDIYLEFQPKIHRYLCNFAGEEDALDLTQTVFLKVSRSLDSFRGDSSLSTWIYRIATNTAHDHASSSLAKQKSCELLLDDDGSVDDLPDRGFQGTDSVYIRKEMTACIRGVVDKLPENYRVLQITHSVE